MGPKGTLHLPGSWSRGNRISAGRQDTVRQERPKIFIGSSAESLGIARAIQTNLDYFAACTIWDQGVFGLGMNNIEALAAATRQHDFAVLVANAQDYIAKRNARGYAPRDNILFELGMFTGALGSHATFFVFDRSQPPILPSDLQGLNAATYSTESQTSLRAALGAACTQIEEAVRRNFG